METIHQFFISDLGIVKYPSNCNSCKYVPEKRYPGLLLRNDYKVNSTALLL